jgi:hypothetical protein
MALGGLGLLDSVGVRPWFKIAVVGLVALGTSACSTMQPSQLATSALMAGKARIVLQRTNETLHATSPATAKVNGTKVADVAAGQTAIVDVAPGPMEFTVEAWSYPGQYTIPLQVREGETIKVEIAPRPSKTAGILGPIGGFVDKDENGNGGAFTAKQVANLDGAAAPLNVPPATQ